MNIFKKLDRIKEYITDIEKELNGAPEKVDIIDLIKACENLDRDYKENFCEEHDRMEGLPEGATYTGDDDVDLNIEYYCNADAWRDISKILRNLRGE